MNGASESAQGDGERPADYPAVAASSPRRQGIIVGLDADTASLAPLRRRGALDGSTLRQLLRFSVVGIGLNGTLYGAYLVLVGAGVPIKSAMSLTYACGVVLGFLLNRRWSFDRPPTRGDASRYLAAYAAGYVLNLAALALFVDAWGLAHQGVQAAMVIVIAALLFLAQKYWVFRPAQQPTTAHRP